MTEGEGGKGVKHGEGGGKLALKQINIRNRLKTILNTYYIFKGKIEYSADICNL